MQASYSGEVPALSDEEKETITDDNEDDYSVSGLRKNK